MSRCVRIPLCVTAFVMGLGVSFADRLEAQTLRTLHYFTGTDGAAPQGGLVLGRNTLYGVTAAGGAGSNGVVFAVNADGTGFNILHNFAPLSSLTNNDGASPLGGLVLSGNTLYGAGSAGGKWAAGTIFSLNTDGTGFKTLHNFTNIDGAGPNGGLLLSGNTLFGTTSGGGVWGRGTVFALTTDGLRFTNLHSFAATAPFFVFPTNSDGAGPNGGLVLSGNVLYGTANSAGVAGGGTVFAVNTDGSGFKPLTFFFQLQPGSFTTGMFPNSGMALWGNRLYGTTPYGGPTCEGDPGIGKVFTLSTDGTGFADVHSFLTNNGTCRTYPIINNDGAIPFGGVITDDGKTLYGMTSTGGTEASGTVFAVGVDGTDFVTLHTFTNIDGETPTGSLVLSGNNLYGATLAGGTLGNGTLFSISFTPQLGIIPSVSNCMVTWPTGFAGFDYSRYTLQSTTNLVSPGWATNLPAPVVVNGQYTVTNPVSATPQFFRLSQQPN